MNTKFETVFRTHSYRLYPTKMQQLELKALFDLQDHTFNDWADLANRGVAQGKSYETIQKEIESHEILTERREDRYALSVTRSHILTLARRLYDHQIERICFRLPDRQQRSFTYKTVGISAHYLVIPSIGTIAMHDYRPFPDHAELRYAKVLVACYGAYLGKQPLEREYITCPHCGVTNRRDHNAARNIRDEGFRCLEESPA